MVLSSDLQLDTSFCISSRTYLSFNQRFGNAELSVQFVDYLNVLEFVNTATLTKLRTKIISYFISCDRYKTIRQQITSDIVLNYPLFNLFNDTEKTIFLFNNADFFICKKLGYFIYEALHISETCNFI